MEHDTFACQMRLLHLLTGNCHLTANDLCAQLSISHRTFFRYIHLFRASGFHVSLRAGIYSINLTSPLFAAVHDKWQLSPSEVDTISRLLRKAGDQDLGAMRLRQHMETVYGMAFSIPPEEWGPRQLLIANAETLAQAIREQRQAVLPAYESPHSQTRSDRLVEPYKLIENSASVRCYEVATAQCKTFKIARIGAPVELLPQAWEHRSDHTNYYTDLFGFSGESVHRVTLRLGPLAARILCEEYGVQETQFAIDTDGIHRLFSIGVCQYKGLERFVMGLLNDIEVVRGAEFLTHLRHAMRLGAKQLGLSVK